MTNKVNLKQYRNSFSLDRTLEESGPNSDLTIECRYHVDYEPPDREVNCASAAQVVGIDLVRITGEHFDQITENQNPKRWNLILGWLRQDCFRQQDQWISDWAYWMNEVYPKYPIGT